MADFDIPPFIPPDDSDDDLSIEEVAATVNPAPPSIPTPIFPLPAPPPSLPVYAHLPSPPRKRQRTESLDMVEKDTLTSPVPTQDGPPQHDADYYMVDGSCVLLVENTLFNVHRTMLSRDSSFFETLFTIPQGEARPDGLSDEKPIVLRGDTVAAFKNFLWVLYALPHDILSACNNSSNLPRLIDIAHVSNKYAFKSLETWSLDAIVDTVTRKAAVPTPFPFASHTDTSSLQPRMNNAQIVTLVRLAQLCGHERLMSTMVAMLRKLMSGSVRDAYLAMALADELDLGALRGAAYFEVLQNAQVSVLTPAHEHDGRALGDLDSAGNLLVSRVQRMRLLEGYYRLSMLWEKLREEPLRLDHAAPCALGFHHHACAQSWHEFWRDKTRGEAVMKCGLADVLGRLRAVGREFERQGVTMQLMYPECRTIARKVISERAGAVQETLSSYFTDGE